MRAVRVLGTCVWIVSAMYLAADTTNAVIRSALRPARSSAALRDGPPRYARPEADVRPLSYFFDPIVRENVFLHGEPVPGEEVASTVEASSPEDTCTLPVQVLGAVVAPNSPQLSVVSLRETGGKKKLHVVQVGERALDQATLVRVETPFVEGKLRKQTIAVFERDDLTRFACRTGEAATSVSASLPAGMPTGAGIQRLSDTEYEIPQAEIDAVMNGGLATLATTVRVIPYFEAGKSSGFKLYSIKPGTLLSKMGLSNGDVLKKVNGYDISSPEKALEVYGILKSERNVTVDLTRGGKPRTIRYSIR